MELGGGRRESFIAEFHEDGGCAEIDKDDAIKEERVRVS